MKVKIKDFENYELYDNGDVVNTSTGKQLKGSIRLNGYKEYRLSKNNQKFGFYAHRLVAEHFIPNPENLPVVNHKDGNKLNNDISNLEWVSYAENVLHAHSNKLIGKHKKAEYYTDDLPDEYWIEIPGFNNYLLSNYARIQNQKTKLLLKPSIACGYQKVRLSEQGKVQDFILHILMYKTFNQQDIPDGYKIDHIDGNKTNNHIKNLRCVSNSENALAAYYQTHTNSAIKPVVQCDKKGRVIRAFPSCREAARQLNLDSSTISKVCRGINKTHGGYIFHYISLEEFKSFNDYPEIVAEE